MGSSAIGRNFGCDLLANDYHRRKNLPRGNLDVRKETNLQGIVEMAFLQSLVNADSNYRLRDQHIQFALK